MSEKKPSPKRVASRAMVRTANVMRMKHGERLTFGEGPYVHVWFDEGVSQYDMGGRNADSGEWQAIASTSPDPFNRKPRGTESAAKYFRYVEPRQKGSVARMCADFIKKVTGSYQVKKTASMDKTAGEVRFIKDRGGDEKNFAWANTGPSQREISQGFEFSPAKLKPLAKCLRATLMALGHAQSAYHDFTKIKSAQISPDGNLGGKGYIQQIPEMRRQYMNVSEALSALSDTIYDEINAPHWAVQAGDEQATSRTRDDVAEIMDDVEEIRENPEAVAEDMEEKWENEPGHAKTAGGELSVRVNGSTWRVTIQSRSDVYIEGRGVDEYGSLSRSGQLEDFQDVPDAVLDALEAEIKKNSRKIRLAKTASASRVARTHRRGR